MHFKTAISSLSLALMLAAFSTRADHHDEIEELKKIVAAQNQKIEALGTNFTMHLRVDSPIVEDMSCHDFDIVFVSYFRNA